MKIERAIEILDPEHREHYESIEPVKEACRMGMEALKKQIPKKPKYGYDEQDDIKCPECDGTVGCMDDYGIGRDKYCGECGQALDWSDEM